MLNNFLFYLFICFFVSIQVSARITVKSVKADQNSVIVTLSEQDEVSVGRLLEYKDRNGNSCEVEIKKISRMLAVAEATMCDDLNILKPGRVLNLQKNGETNVRRKPQSEGSGKGLWGRGNSGRSGRLYGFTVGIHAYYSTANIIYYSVKISDTESKSIQKTTNAGGLGLSLNYITESSVAINLGVEYELERKILSNQSENGNITNFTDGEALAFAIADFNLGYMILNKFIFFVGVNMPSPIAKNWSPFIFAGMAGYQFGMTYRPSRNFGLDVMNRYLNLKVTNSEEEININQTLFDGTSFGISYFF